MPEIWFRQDPLVSKAFDIADEAHANQLYGNRPYIEHPLEVGLLAQQLGYHNFVVAGCLLHDVPEDTSIDELGLLKAGMPDLVVAGVAAVTYRYGKETLSKIEKARTHPIGQVIKFCDSSRNFASSIADIPGLDAERPGKGLEYATDYANKIGHLSIGLPTPDDISRYVQLHTR